MPTVTVWVILLFNVFHQYQGTLPDQYKTKNDCQVAMVQQGYADINVLGVHGECQAISGTRTK